MARPAYSTCFLETQFDVNTPGSLVDLPLTLPDRTFPVLRDVQIYFEPNRVPFTGPLIPYLQGPAIITAVGYRVVTWEGSYYAQPSSLYWEGRQVLETFDTLQLFAQIGYYSVRLSGYSLAID